MIITEQRTKYVRGGGKGVAVRIGGHQVAVPHPYRISTNGDAHRYVVELTANEIAQLALGVLCKGSAEDRDKIFEIGPNGRFGRNLWPTEPLPDPDPWDSPAEAESPAAEPEPPKATHTSGEPVATPEPETTATGALLPKMPLPDHLRRV